jgi:hypothetical protein
MVMLSLSRARSAPSPYSAAFMTEETGLRIHFSRCPPNWKRSDEVESKPGSVTDSIPYFDIPEDARRAFPPAEQGVRPRRLLISWACNPKSANARARSCIDSIRRHRQEGRIRVGERAAGQADPVSPPFSWEGEGRFPPRGDVPGGAFWAGRRFEFAKLHGGLANSTLRCKSLRPHRLRLWEGVPSLVH